MIKKTKNGGKSKVESGKKTGAGAAAEGMSLEAIRKGLPAGFDPESVQIREGVIVAQYADDGTVVDKFVGKWAVISLKQKKTWPADNSVHGALANWRLRVDEGPTTAAIKGPAKGDPPPTPESIVAYVENLDDMLRQEFAWHSFDWQMGKRSDAPDGEAYDALSIDGRCRISEDITRLAIEAGLLPGKATGAQKPPPNVQGGGEGKAVEAAAPLSQQASQAFAELGKANAAAGVTVQSQKLVKLTERINAQKIDVGDKALHLAKCKALAKSAKDNFDAAVEELDRLTLELHFADNPAPTPLFDDPSLRNPTSDVRDPKSQGSTAGERPTEEAWRAVLIEAAIGTLWTDKLAAEFEKKNLHTLGELSDWQARGFNKLTDLDGVGPGKSEKIELAIEAWWGRNPEMVPGKKEGERGRGREGETKAAPGAGEPAKPVPAIPEATQDYLLSLVQVQRDYAMHCWQYATGQREDAPESIEWLIGDTVRTEIAEIIYGDATNAGLNVRPDPGEAAGAVASASGAADGDASGAANDLGF